MYFRRSTGQNATGSFVRLDGLPPFLQPGRTPQCQLVELGTGHEHELSRPGGRPATPAERYGHRPVIAPRSSAFVLLLLLLLLRRWHLHHHAVVLFGRQTMRLGGHHAHARHIAVVRHAHYGALYHCKREKRQNKLLLFRIIYWACFGDLETTSPKLISYRRYLHWSVVVTF